MVIEKRKKKFCTKSPIYIYYLPEPYNNIRSFLSQNQKSLHRINII